VFDQKAILYACMPVFLISQPKKISNCWAIPGNCWSGYFLPAGHICCYSANTGKPLIVHTLQNAITVKYNDPHNIVLRINHAATLWQQDVLILWHYFTAVEQQNARLCTRRNNGSCSLYLIQSFCSLSHGADGQPWLSIRMALGAVQLALSVYRL